MDYCHTCDITALGCSGCDAVHGGLTTHVGRHLGLASSALSGKDIVYETLHYLSAAIMAEASTEPSGETMGRFSRCRISAASQHFAQQMSEKLGPEILPQIEKILLDDEAAKAAARQAAQEAAIERVRLVAKKAAEEAATVVATKIANHLAPIAAREAAIEPATKKANEVATEIANHLAPIAARDAAIEPATKKANEVATEIANHLAPIAARDAAIKPASETAAHVATDKATEIAKAIVGRELEKLQERETKANLDRFVNTQIGGHINKAEVQRRIAAAAKNAGAVTIKYMLPEKQATEVPRLALYDFIVLCDDSGSMRSGRRIATLEATVRGLIGILRDLGSDRPFSIVPFEGAVYNNLPDLTSVNNALRNIKYETSAGALDPLRQRVIRPLESLAKRKSLNPTVVVVVTDGDVGDVGSFGNSIAKFKKTLIDNDYAGPVALFLICRVGDDEHAAVTLKGLSNNDKIKSMLLYSDDQLDSRLAQMGGSIEKYTGWVVSELLKAMELQLIRE